MAKRKWLLPVAALGRLLAYNYVRRSGRRRATERPHSCAMPSPAIYDAFSSLLLSGLYRKVAGEIVKLCPSGMVLDAGCGPGHLATRLGEMARDVSVIGVDIDPGMIGRARHRATRAGLASRVQFEVADVAQLPFPDQQFDCAVSTLSLHHWPDPERGLNELYRVLKPGANAYIYDMSGRLQKLLLHGKAALQRAAEASPFRGGEITAFRWPGPLCFTERIHLQR